MQEIIIIGAGPAGLTAAYELLRTPGEYSVHVLEATDAIGGISRTVQAGGNRMDIGGHRFFSKSPQVVRWWEELMPTQGAPALDDKLLGRQKPLVPGGPDPETEDRVMLVRDRVSRIYYDGNFFDYPVTLNWNTLKNMGFARTMKAGFSYLASVFRKLPEDSLENFYINRFGRVLYGMFFEGYTEKLWGRHPREISADWGAQRVKGLSIAAVIKNIFGKLLPGKREVETSLIEQFFYPKYGPGQLWELVASLVEERGGHVHMGARVNRLLLEHGHAAGVGYTQDGEDRQLRADAVFSTMPVKDLLAAWGAPAPEAVKTAAAGLPYRDFVTVGLLVPRLKLRNETRHKTLGDIVPDCWIYVQEPSVKVGRLQIFNNWSPYMVEDPEHTVWVGMEYFCDEGDEFWSMDDEACIAFATEELERMGVIEPGAALFAHRERVQKAYPAYFDTYAQIGEVTDFLDGCENLYCIGRNGQHRYNNMDHSMMTAIEAVGNLRSGRSDKANIWNVNTEQAYHEEK